MASTVRAVRECVVCGEGYRPTYWKQRTCGRSCGAYLKFGFPTSDVEWLECSACDRWVTRGSRHRHAAPVKNASWMTAPIECPTCGETFTNPFTTVAVHCSTRCSRKAIKLRRRVREAGSYGEWRWSDFMRIAKKFDYRCAYCGEKPDRLDPDHVVPLSKGGANIIGNLLPTCAPCNSDKQAYSLAGWAERLAAQGRERRTAWAPDDRRYWHLTVRVESLGHAG
jgi:predicted nucleic acid-binding Zn ribbon protein